MSWHEFVFSDKRTQRISRHLIFWLLWWMYFAATYYYYLQVGLQKIDFGDLTTILLINSLLLVVVHACACYVFIYILLPRFLLRSKYTALTAGIILLSAFLLASGYFIHKFIFPYIDSAFNYKTQTFNNTIWWTSINSVLLNAPKVIAAAAAIKLVKRWYIKQKEKEQIEREKLITDLQLLKAQIHPGFLFSSLDHIYLYAKSNSAVAPELLLKLSDLLSYMLYECDEPQVALEKELNMMKEYMYMEKMGYADTLECETEIKGDTNNKLIAPLLLLPFIEDSFKHCNNQSEQSWINLHISIQNDTLTMKLMNGISLTHSIELTDEILNVQKRLELLYPGKHELKIYAEEEIYIMLLKIDLDDRHIPHAVISADLNKQELKPMYADQ
ncbi:MAG: putative regulator of cell autolysis [Chitinophagaceae bacterium]|nr:putative regulator of cell autolysis [Chitinophagaceae bacterium]